jgi:hypothetical protein
MGDLVEIYRFSVLGEIFGFEIGEWVWVTFGTF